MAAEDQIATLLTCTLYDARHKDLIWVPRYRHRLAISNAWALRPGSCVLDIGCGQGESSLALALAVGPDGRVTGIDTAAPEYGTPFNIGQSQAHVRASELGDRIAFLYTDAASLLASSDPDNVDADIPPFDAAAMCHSLWYFPTRDSVRELFATLSGAGIPRLYVAEYGFIAGAPAQVPHMLAARAQALLHAYTTAASEQAEEALGKDVVLPANVRAAPSTDAIIDAAVAAGYAPARQGTLTPAADYKEGLFETRYVAGDRFEACVRERRLPSAQEAEILALVAKVRRAVNELAADGVDTVRSMDVWWAEFELRPSASVP